MNWEEIKKLIFDKQKKFAEEKFNDKNGQWKQYWWGRLDSLIELEQEIEKLNKDKE